MPRPQRFYRDPFATAQKEPPKLHIRSTYARLLRYIRPYWWQVGLVLLISVGSALLSTLPPQVIGLAVDELLGDRPTAAQPGDAPAPVRPPAAARRLPIAGPVRALTTQVGRHCFRRADPNRVVFGVLAGCFLGLTAAGSVATMLHRFLMAQVGQRLTYDMRNQVYGHLQSLSMTYFENNRTGDIMSRVVNDVNSLDQVIVGPVIGFVTDIFRLVWILYFCLTWDWRLTLLALVVAPLVLTCTFAFGRLIRRNFRDLRTRVGELNALTNDNISGMRVIKVFSRETHEAARFADTNRAVFRQNVRIARMFAVFRPTIGFLTASGSAVVLFYGGYKALTGQMTAGTLVVFFPYLAMLYGPITGLTRFWSFIQRAVASVERVFEVLDTEPAVQDAPDATDVEAVGGEVEFRHVRFAYAGGPDVLLDIDLHVQPGQMVAFVGPSGAGKSTLTGLLLRFYDPVAGSVRVDGRDVRALKARSLRRHMAMVQQEPFLFNETVRANIAYGKTTAQEGEVEAAAKAANAHAFIEELTNGYDTLVGERGVKLSGGQKQRISIARAVLADPAILILDEATSSVDSEAEALIQNAIANLAANRTTFVIAHRLSTVLHADQIIVLDHGRIVERGTHAQLLARDALYKKLFDMQFAGAPQTCQPSSPPAPSPQAVEELPDDESARLDRWQPN